MARAPVARATLSGSSVVVTVACSASACLSGVSAPAARGAASDCDDDLADLLVGFQKAVRVDNLHQRERPGDHRLQVSLSKTFQDQLVIAGEALRVVPDLRGQPAADAQALEGGGPVGVWRVLAAESPVVDDRTFGGRGLSQHVNLGTAHRIEDDPGAETAGDALYLGEIVDLLRGHHVLRTVLL